MTNPLPPLDDLDGIFALPEHVADPELRAMYEILVVRMRRELRAVRPNVTTMELLVCERAAYNYILMKAKDQHAVGAEDGFSSMSAVKEFNAFWMQLAKMVTENMRQSNEEFKNQLRDSVAKALGDAMEKTVQDSRLRETIQRRIIADLTASANL